MTDPRDNRVDHAAKQLDDAISLFLEGQFVSAIRLAGAAEEILTQELSYRGQQNFLDSKYETLEPLLTMQHQTKEDFIEEENRALNAVTHMESPSDSSVTLDLEDAALWMIVRACDNS